MSDLHDNSQNNGVDKSVGDSSEHNAGYETGALPETIVDDLSIPLEDLTATTAEIENIKTTDGKQKMVGLEQIHDIDAPRPVDHKSGKRGPVKPEHIHDDAASSVNPTAQFDPSVTKKTQDKNQAYYINSNPLSPHLIGDDVFTSVPGDCGSDLQITAVNNPRFIHHSSWADGEIANGTSPVDSRSRVPSTSINIDTAATANQTSILQNASIREIAEAYVVDEEVFVATPTKPFWRQSRVLILLALVITAVIVAIAVGVSSSKNPTTTQLIMETSTSPSTSLSPTSSMIPSTSPSSCAFTIVANTEQIKLLNPNPGDISTALDGDNLIVASIWRSNSTAAKSFYLEFYSLIDGVWDRTGHFIKANVDFDYGVFNTALSSNTAVVVLPYYVSGEIFAYKLNGFGFWEEIDPPLPSRQIGCGYFGESLDIDGNIVAVSDQWYCPMMITPNAAYIFRQDGDKWEGQVIGQVDGEEDENNSIEHIAVSGNTLALANGFYQAICSGGNPFIDIYRVDNNTNKFTRAQRLEAQHANILSVSLNGDQLVVVEAAENQDYFYTVVTSIMVYQRDNDTQPFTFQESMNASDYADGFGSHGLVLGEDLLVVGSNNYTHIFSLKSDGTWEETLTLDQVYATFQLSGRTLIGTTEDEVHYMNVERCSQAMPTVAPSLAATNAASTSCEWVNVTFSCNPDRNDIGYSECIILYNGDGFWESRIETSEFIPSDRKVVEAFEALEDIPSAYYGLEHQYSVNYTTCVQPGQYQFVFRAENSDSRPYYAHYKVESNGKVIAQEQLTLGCWEGEIDNMHRFSIPFDPTEENSPTGGPFTPRPTSSPTTSTAPTVAQYPSWSHTPTPYPTNVFTRSPTGSSYPSSETPQPTTSHFPSWVNPPLPTYQSIFATSPYPTILSGITEHSPSRLSEDELVGSTQAPAPGPGPSTSASERPHVKLPFPTFFYSTWPPTASLDGVVILSPTNISPDSSVPSSSPT